LQITEKLYCESSIADKYTFPCVNYSPALHVFSKIAGNSPGHQKFCAYCWGCHACPQPNAHGTRKL